MIHTSELGIKALTNSFAVYTKLGESGKEDLQKNQFGDTAMKGDYEAEEAVLSVLKEASFPVVVHSEEHGIINITDKPRYLAVLDGIDGSHWYKTEWSTGRYGTMFGIYEGTNPAYSDYVFGGVMEHATGRLFYGVKGKGAFVLHVDNGRTEPIHVSAATELNTSTKIHIDEYWDINNEVFTSKLKGYTILEYKLCSSVHYTDVAQGTVDLTLECTRKGTLEIAAAYPLIQEAGGTMVSITGEHLADKRYLEFGQDTHIPVITAATEILAQSAVEYFNKK